METPFSITLKIDSKGSVYGEFTVRGATADELQEKFYEARQLLLANVDIRDGR